MNCGSCLFSEHQAITALKDKRYNNDIRGSHSGARELSWQFCGIWCSADMLEELAASIFRVCTCCISGWQSSRLLIFFIQELD